MKRRCSIRLDLLLGKTGWAWQMFHRSVGANQGITGLIPFPCSVDPIEIIESLHSTLRQTNLASLQKWGNDTCNNLFPDVVKSEFSHFDSGDILFIVPNEWADVPFEMLLLPKGFLGEIFLVGTIIRTESQNIPAKTHPQSGSMVIVADPATRLQAARTEGEKLKNFVASKKQQVRLITQADPEKLITEIPNASIVHFAGHSYAKQDTGFAGWELSDGARFDTGDIRETGSGASMPGLVFSNSCYGGSFGADAGLSGIAGAFLSAGVPQVIGPTCAINDSDAEHCALSFYESLFKGMTAAESLRSMRRANTTGLVAIAPLLYRLFGDPIYQEPEHAGFADDASDRHARKRPSLKKVVLTVMALLMLAVGICVIAVNNCDSNSVIYIPSKESTKSH